ncbi:ankyrin [Tothia fuscella]|uniref:Ankyrin n=1 Tax=Tothia fuscella TaxID=1048955 RepID=A0A9P4P157_9PEZI|nr:ankyrin [Tothia fuscella]
MHILECPAEILRSVFGEIILTSVQQAMHARMVCRLFDVELIRALCTSKILSTPAFADRPVEPSILTKYLVTIARKSESSSSYPAINVILHAVKYVLEQWPQDEERRLEYIRTLCQLMVSGWPGDIHPTVNRTLRTVSGPPSPSGCWTGSPKQNIMAVATHFGLNLQVESMLNDGVKDHWTHFHSSIFRAVERNDLQLVSLLLERGGSASLISMNCLGHAAQHGNQAMLELLLSAISNQKELFSGVFLDTIECAAAGGQLPLIHFLLQWGLTHYKVIDIDALTARTSGYQYMRIYDAILFQASLHGQQHVVEEALHDNADLCARPKISPLFGGALDAAASQGHEGVVRVLLRWAERDPYPSPYYLQCALLTAMKRGWYKIAQLLLEHGVELDYGTTCSETCFLMAAVKCGQLDMLRLLLDVEGLDWRVDSDGCEEAYSWVVSRGYASITRELIERGLGPVENRGREHGDRRLK